MTEDDFSDLLNRYQQMLVSGKNVYFDADEYDELAEYYEKLDDVEVAKEIVELGLKTHPNNDSLMLRRGRFMVYDGNYSAAMSFLNTYFSGYDFELYLLKIECLLNLGLYAEAHQLTTEVVEDEDTAIDLKLSELGFVYVEAEYLDEAILYFEKSLDYNAENLEVLYDLIYAYEMKGDFKEAIDTAEKVLDVDPYLLDAWLALGRLHSLQENYEKSIDAFDFALTLDDSNVTVMKLKAHCLVLSERFEEAIELLKQCIEMSPDDEILHMTLIDCYMDLGQAQNMYTAVLDYEKRFGETEESMTKKAFAFFLKGWKEELSELLVRIKTSDFESFYTNTMVGDLFFKMEDYDTAQFFYLKALASGKDFSDESILEKIVDAYIRMGDLENAIKYQKKLLELAESLLAKEKLAMLYIEIGNKEQFQSYLDSFTDSNLLSLYNVFHKNEEMTLADINRDVLLKRLESIYESRILYKNIKY